MTTSAIRDGVAHHTYSAYDRGVEQLMGTYQVLDLAPPGRNEGALEYSQIWWHRHDENDVRPQEAWQ